MRKIHYIFIHSDDDTRHQKSPRRAEPLIRYHFVVNSQALVLNPTDIQQTINLIEGPLYDRDKYNNCSIYIRHCGSRRPEPWLITPGTSCAAVLRQRAALIHLLVHLRTHFPDAKILGLSEIKGKALHSNNIIVSDTMNLLRRELSDHSS